MRRVGWHLDDVPQPFLTLRRLAFLVIVLVCVGAGVCGVLLVYDGRHHRSMLVPLMLMGGVFVFGAFAGGVFGWTNTKSPRWRQWRKTMPSLTPGWPPDDHEA